MRLLGFRRGPRPRTADDDDWGTSSPAAIMDPPDGSHPHSSSFNFSSAVSRLQQQDLKSYTCTFSPRCVVSLYLFIAVVFIPLGISVLVASSSVGSTGGRIRYDRRCKTQSRKPCVLEFPINSTIKAPSYLYYSLTNFYQNARIYAKSRSDIMNQGKKISTLFEVETCEPYLFRDGTPDNASFSPDNLVYPCGLAAKSFFNDTLRICKDRECKMPVKMRSKGIAWWTDTKYKFNKGEGPLFNEIREPWKKSANELLDNDDFVVWMRLSAFPNFMKLYRIIEEDLPKNKYYVEVHDEFPVELFGGTKSFLITTTTWTGGANPFLGTAYVVVGVLAVLTSLTILFKHVLSSRSTSLRDPSILLRDHLEKYVLNTDQDD